MVEMNQDKMGTMYSLLMNLIRSVSFVKSDEGGCLIMIMRWPAPHKDHHVPRQRAGKTNLKGHHYHLRVLHGEKTKVRFSTKGVFLHFR